MKRKAFVKRRAEFVRRDARKVGLQVAGLICGLALLQGVLHFFPELNDAVVIVMLVAAGLLLIWILRIPNQAKEEGLVCRSCGGGLLNAPGDHAIATGRCPHCGGDAFDE